MRKWAVRVCVAAKGDMHTFNNSSSVVHAKLASLKLKGTVVLIVPICGEFNTTSITSVGDGVKVPGVILKFFVPKADATR